MDPTDPVGALARWHTEPYDPALDDDGDTVPCCDGDDANEGVDDGA